jgi:hypothetical protein
VGRREHAPAAPGDGAHRPRRQELEARLVERGRERIDVLALGDGVVVDDVVEAARRVERRDDRCRDVVEVDRRDVRVVGSRPREPVQARRVERLVDGARIGPVEEPEPQDDTDPAGTVVRGHEALAFERGPEHLDLLVDRHRLVDPLGTAARVRERHRLLH